MPEDITRHSDEGEVIYVGAHTTSYTLRIVEPDPAWAQRYAVIAADLLASLGDHALDIQHVGSTAVPGLPAKPIIDIDLTVPDPTGEAAYVPHLEGLGFVHWLTEPDWHQHRLLKHLDEPRVHLHVFGPDCPEVIRQRMFRDWLIAHPEDPDRYAAGRTDAAPASSCGRLGKPAGHPQRDMSASIRRAGLRLGTCVHRSRAQRVL